MPSDESYYMDQVRAFPGAAPFRSSRQQQDHIDNMRANGAGGISLWLNTMELSYIKKAERERAAAQGQFVTGLGQRLPGAGKDGPDIVGGGIIGTREGKPNDLPFPTMLINGLF